MPTHHHIFIYIQLDATMLSMKHITSWFRHRGRDIFVDAFVFVGVLALIGIGVIIVWVATLQMPDLSSFEERKIQQSTKIYDRETGEVHYGRVPAGSVVVSGSLPSKCGKYSLYAAIIVKKVDAQTRSKVGLNELLRVD